MSMKTQFTISPASGLIEPAAQRRSPNRDARPDGVEPRLVVLHGISLPPGQFGGAEIEALFTNALDHDAHPYFDEIRGLNVSAHLLIRRDGSVTQFVPFTERAWHAGESCFRGDQRCNDYSIGIELEGEDETPYDDRQYEALWAILRALFHGKSDPGPAFDWLRLYDGLVEG